MNVSTSNPALFEQLVMQTGEALARVYPEPITESEHRSAVKSIRSYARVIHSVELSDWDLIELLYKTRAYVSYLPEPVME